MEGGKYRDELKIVADYPTGGDCIGYWGNAKIIIMNSQDKLLQCFGLDTSYDNFGIDLMQGAYNKIISRIQSGDI